MEKIMKSLAGVRGILLVGVLLMTGAFAVSRAATDQDTLKQYLADLQKNPSDQALREKIIKLVSGMKIKPAVPDEAVEREGAAEYAFKNAKKESDYANAAAEYEKALLLAPWVANDYFNCGVAYEMAGKPKDAIRCFNLYLIAAPDAKDANDVRKRIGGLKFAAEEAEKEAQAQQKEKADAEAKQRQTREVLDQLKKIVGGANYDMWVASTESPEKITTGVNEEEYKGNNWYLWTKSSFHYLFKDDRVLICFIGSLPDCNHPHLIGIPNGPTIKDILWQRQEFQNDEIAKYGKEPRQVWAEFDEKNGDIKWSEDRPLKFGDYDPKIRYYYTWYRRD